MKLASTLTGLLVLWATAASADDLPNIPFEKYTLDNGMEVILHQDKRVPIVAVNVWYHVGSGNEVPGRSGFAHLFEHMLFQGSKHVGEDKHFDVLRGIGATSVNGTTNTDRTNYFEVVPSNQLETALWLESDRMGYFLPNLTKKSFRNQVDVVRNERRQSYDNRPYGKSFLKLVELLFPENHPYKYSVIGKHSDLESATLKDVTDFYKKWYTPANATLTIAGDFDPQTAKKLVEKWFGSFPKSKKPPRIQPQLAFNGARKVTLKDNMAQLRQLDYAWTTPHFYAPGDAEFDILSQVLGAPGTGRLYKRLVLKDQTAQRVSVSQYSTQQTSMFLVSAQLKPGAKIDQVKKAIAEEMDGVLKGGIKDDEFKRARIKLESSFIWGLESLLARSDLLQRYNHYTGDPGYLAKDLARYKETSAAKAVEYGKKYLTDDRRVEVITLPGKDGK